MKKIYFVLLLIVVLSSISLVSAAENVSTSDNLLGVDNVDTLSKNIDAVSNVSPVSNDVVASENSSNDGGPSVNGADDSINQTNSSNNSSSDDDVKEKPVVTKVVTKDVSSTYGTIMNYNVKVLDQFGQPMAGKSVAVTIGKKTVTKVTDDSGMVTFTLNCQAGKYVIKYKVDAISGSNSYNVKNKITMSTLNWGIKGDVSKVSLIKKNMPNNAWVKKAVAATKKGIPLLKFVGGKGKIVFMTAGVHGNELSSQVAAMKMIDYLTKNPISTLTITFSNQTLSYEIYDKSISYDFRFSTSVLPENLIRGDVHTGSLCTSNPYNVYLQSGGIYGKPISTKEN